MSHKKSSEPCPFCPHQDDKSSHHHKNKDKKKQKDKKNKQHKSDMQNHYQPSSSPGTSSYTPQYSIQNGSPYLQASVSSATNFTEQIIDPVSKQWWDRYNSLKPQFERATELIKHLNQRPADDELLQLYGLFKQVTQGDCPVKSSAGLFDLKAKRKEDAWRKYSGMDQLDAMQGYIDLATSLCVRYHLSNQKLTM